MYKPEYPNCKEVSPLQQTIEGFEKSPEVSIRVSDTPPLPRIWFLHKNDNSIIQIQQDRFLHNWRKNLPEDEYPRYPKVIKIFKDHLSIFLNYIKETEIGPIQPNQYEMTYVNHISQGEGWETLNDIGNIFRDFGWDNSNKAILSDPSDLNLRVIFDLPNVEGRLHIKVVKSFLGESKQPILRLDLTVRGMSKEKSEKGMWNWFDQAREWIVRGFADFTTENAQNSIWKRKI